MNAVLLMEEDLTYKHQAAKMKGDYIMYTYKTEILKVSTKFWSDKADEGDAAELDALLNLRSAEGWELVTYDYMATSVQIRGAFIVTFRKQQ